MSCCCPNPYLVKCGNICDGFVIAAPAPADGIYSLFADFIGGMIKIDADLLAGDNLVFDMSNINLFTWYVFRVFFNGVELAFKDDIDTEYQCFQVRAQPFGSALTTIPLAIIP
jgi:hypothetical protein